MKLPFKIHFEGELAKFKSLSACSREAFEFAGVHTWLRQPMNYFRQ